MKVEINEQKDNLLLKRKEVRFTVDHKGGSTPTKGAVTEELKKLIKANGSVIVIDNMESVFGTGVTKGYAKAYDSLEAAFEVEKEHIMARNGYTKPEYKASEPEAE